MRRGHGVAWVLGVAALLTPSIAKAQTAEAPTGAPPADAKALVDTPKDTIAPPSVNDKTSDATTATVAAGGQWSTGNSQLLAGTANGAFEMRRGANGFGASLLANYGQGAPGGSQSILTSENAQGRLRYDRYLLKPLSVFLIATGRYDRFQGLDFRLNLDPGVKYLFVHTTATTFWGELGYDFQYDIRRNQDRVINDADGNPVVSPVTGQIELLDKTQADHSVRSFVGFKHAFNKEVTFATGLEYLQSFIDTDRARINYDALLAANLGAGFSFGLGFGARYDHAPLPGKQDLDTVTTLNLIFAFSDVKDDKPPMCPCEPPAAAPTAPSSLPAAPASPPPSAPASWPPTPPPAAAAPEAPPSGAVPPPASPPSATPTP